MVMLIQRTRGAENRVENRSLNGSRRAWSKVFYILSIPRREAYVSCQGYDSILMRAQITVKQGGTADMIVRP